MQAMSMRALVVPYSRSIAKPAKHPKRNARAMRTKGDRRQDGAMSFRLSVFQK
jgi:hypothetical protein